MERNSPPGSSSNDNKHDDGEHFEFNFFGLFKIKCKRVTAKVLIAIALIFIFTLLILCELSGLKLVSKGVTLLYNYITGKP